MMSLDKIETVVQWLHMSHAVFAGFSGHDNSTFLNLKKKENVHLFPCPWGYDYVDVYLQSSWEDVALEVTLSSGRVWI